jgi:hypothetical protein
MEPRDRRAQTTRARRQEDGTPAESRGAEARAREPEAQDGGAIAQGEAAAP